MKKRLIYWIVLACCSIVGCIGLASAATEKGADTMILESTIDPAKIPRPAMFTHGAHQACLECGTCHHGADADGNRIEYSEGVAIEKCASCHNSSAAMPDKLSTFKDAAHAQCISCHRATDEQLTQCIVCHN